MEYSYSRHVLLKVLKLSLSGGTVRNDLPRLNMLKRVVGNAYVLSFDFSLYE